MRTQLLQLLAFIFLMVPVTICAQKNIILHESLAANADQYKVKMGTQGFLKIWKFRFGDYAVVSSKNKGSVTTEKGNFLNTKTESKSTEKFSFNLGIGSDVATVKAARNVGFETTNEIRLFSHVYWGNDEVIRRSDNFLAVININEDTTETWALLVKSEHDATGGDKFEGALTNGTRQINISSASSNKEGESNRSLPALGYQFDENGLYLGAVQYYGGGMLGMNKNIVWINKGIDAKLKLIVAAAMTALLQIKVTPPE
jgi:hypothetical protein